MPDNELPENVEPVRPEDLGDPEKFVFRDLDDDGSEDKEPEIGN